MVNVLFTFCQRIVYLKGNNMRVNFLFMGNKLTVQQLERALKERGIRKDDFMAELSLSKQRYQNWKNRGIPGNELQGISSYMKISIDELMGQNAPKPQYRSDRQDIHETINRLPSRLLNKARLALELFVEDAAVNPPKTGRKRA